MKKVVNYSEGNEAAAGQLVQRLKDGGWFGFTEIDFEIPRHLSPKFAEMCPLFFTKEVPCEAVPQHMQDYLRSTGRDRDYRKKLVGSLSVEKMLVYAPCCAGT